MTRPQIEKARELGFCFGVRRAIKIIEQAARTHHKSIVTLGPIVHNRLVVTRLAELGVEVITEIDQAEGKIIAIPSHGIAPQSLSQIHSRQLQIIDTTCPIVRSAQRAAKKLADSGFSVIIFGEANHPEVKGLLGWAGDNAMATMNEKEIVIGQLPRRLGILSQTTQSHSRFTEFTTDVINIALPHVQELRVINTLCEETRKRQEAAIELSRKSELMIVVGGHNSANTRHLAEVCAPLVETHLIETANEIETDWLSGKRHIGVTAGASTPDEAIQEVMLKLKSLADGS